MDAQPGRGLDPTPLDDDLLDPALADIAQASDSHDIDYRVRRHADRGEAVRERAPARLADRGISIEVSEVALRRHGMTFDRTADAVRRSRTVCMRD